MVGSIGSTGGLSSSYISQMQQKMVKATDTNGDGSINTEEFVANRPDDVSEEQAQEMWSRFDTENAGSLTTSQFLEAMESQGPPSGPPPGGFGGEEDSTATSSLASILSSASSSSGTDETNELLNTLLDAIEQYTSNKAQSNSVSEKRGESLSDMFGKIDTDEDGSVTAEEFLANRPDDVSEEQAQEMWSRLDTEDSGVLTQSQFVSAMESQDRPPGPPPGGFGGEEDSTTASSSTDETSRLMQTMMEAINKYTSSAGQSAYASSSLTSSLLSGIA